MFYFLLALFSFLQASHSLDAKNHVIEFCNVKDYQKGTLSPRALSKLKEALNIETFVQTGTDLAFTAVEASKVFKHVYAFEPNLEIYLKQLVVCKSSKNITFLYGQLSAKANAFKPKGSTLFYLTRQGLSPSLVLKELGAIGPSNAAILIDDIKLFQPSFYPEKMRKIGLECYPDISEVTAAILKLNPAYQICFLGDALLAFVPTPEVTLSPVAMACLEQRLLTESFNAHRVIATAKGQEYEELITYYRHNSAFELQFGLRSYSTVWFALLMREYGQQYLSESLFRLAADNSISGWIVNAFL